MDKTKQIEKFIRKSIKRNDEIVDENELLSLFDEMTTNEILFFWLNKYSSLAYNTVQTQIPDWKTRDQERYLTGLVRHYHFTPKEKDKNGKYILDRNDLINHVKPHLIIIIKSTISSNLEYKNSPLLEKIPFYLIRFPAVMIPFLFVCFFIPDKKVCNLIVLIFILMFGVSCILYVIVESIIEYRHEEKQKIKNSN